MAKLFNEHDPLTKDPEGLVQHKFAVCERPELLVDHDVMMRVTVKPSVLRAETAAGGPGKQFPLMSSGGFRDSNASSVADAFSPSSQTMSSLEKIHIRALCRGETSEPDYEPTELKIELSSDDDIFFHYVCQLQEKKEHPSGHYDAGPAGEQDWWHIMAYQQVLSPFKDVNKVLARLVRDAMDPNSDIQAVLELDNEEETALLSFNQTSEFRTDALLVLEFKESKPETIKQTISYRISRTKELNTLCKNRIEAITAIVAARNP